MAAAGFFSVVIVSLQFVIAEYQLGLLKHLQSIQAETETRPRKNASESSAETLQQKISSQKTKTNLQYCETTR